MTCQPANIKYPAFKALDGKRVVLASSSPRRISLFNRMGLIFDVKPSKWEEDLDKSAYPSPINYCQATCLKKGQIVRDLTINDPIAPSLIVSSDTVVLCEGQVYEKPVDHADAVRMLLHFRGKTIQPVSAVSILYRVAPGVYKERSFVEETLMHMEESYDQDMIQAYLETGEGMDMSGAFSYLGAGFLMIKGITGCFYNTIGFPCSRFYKEFAQISEMIV